jgi:glutamate dehydrogenase (NADP+)
LPSNVSFLSYDPEGIDVALVKELKEKNRERISKYVETRKGATYYDKESVWDFETAYDIALPCATQNEINKKQAAILVKITADLAKTATASSVQGIFAPSATTFTPFFTKIAAWRMTLRYHVQHKMKSTKSKPLF